MLSCTRESFQALGVDVDAAVAAADAVPLSLHCWQGDDVAGFESVRHALDGGIAATGKYPYAARTPAELREDLSQAMALIPGPLRVSLHASYLEDGGGKVDRDAIEPKHFSGWADWAAEKKIGLDFNTTFFAHPMSVGGTLTHSDAGVRRFWVEHAKRCRVIADYLAGRTGSVCVVNHWIPDGNKERPIRSLPPRRRLLESLDEIFSEKYDSSRVLDAVESKLFGIGAEVYTPGSHEFYLAYALTRPGLLLTLDSGHFHPTEAVSQKVTALFCFFEGLLLHVSRPERWDSDHVVRYDDELVRLMGELVGNGLLDRVKLALDYFDASVNRVAAWVVGARNTRKALLYALLTPYEKLAALEELGDTTALLALTEEYRDLPYGAVWADYCETRGIPGFDWLERVRIYEKTVQARRWRA